MSESAASGAYRRDPNVDFSYFPDPKKRSAAARSRNSVSRDAESRVDRGSGFDGDFAEGRCPGETGSATIGKRREARAPGATPRERAEDNRPTSRKRSKKKSKEVLERSLGILLAAVAVAIVATGLFFMLPHLLRITRVEIRGAEVMSRSEVIAASLLSGNEYFFSIDSDRIHAALLASPRIAEAVVSRRFPNGIRMDIRERKGVAAIFADVEGRTSLVQFDVEGVAFAFGAAPSASAVSKSEAAGTKAGVPAAGARPVSRIDLPVLSGFRFKDFRLGTRLPSSLLPLLSSLAEIGSTAPSLLAAFSEIRVVKTKFGEIELLLYPLHHHIPVRTGADLNESTLRSIILVLDVLATRVPEDAVEEIDFRTGTIVYRSKEGQSG